jgi:hypothetical protein
MFTDGNLLMRLLRRIAAPRPAVQRDRTAMHMEEIEPRILHSADLAPFAFADPSSAHAEIRVVEAAPAAAQAVATEESRTRELVIVDTSTAGYQALVDDIAAQAGAGRQIEIVLIESGADGIRQITDALSGLEGIDAVHIISHGSGGEVRLGATLLDAAALRERGAEIESWAGSLTANADLLIYGCDVAATPEGRQFVDALARLTGADVAASDDLTGNAARGGDWLLEYRAGAIDGPLAVSTAMQQAWQGTLANSAPVLTGANDLPAINEDPSSNNGMKVSDLISTRVTDVDPGSLSGIAVIAVDNTNGVWQYKTNGGGAWTSFGAVSASSARLLTDDANTSVRFVPNVNWNGPVANGLTFRAWDQTSGVAGGTADVNGSATNTVRDEFNLNSYSNNDGTASWNAPWVDTDGSFASGQIQVTANALELNGALLSSSSIYREANIAGATSATLTFDFNNAIGLSTVTLEVSSNGGGSYTQLANSFAGGAGSASFNISAYAAADTRIRLSVSGLLGGGIFTVDNLQISYAQVLTGGATAFSAATASASVTVNPVNDPPIGTDATMVTAEDTPFVFTTASFGCTDPADTPADNLLAVEISSLPASGTLTLGGTAVTAGQSISRVDIAAGSLVYTPVTDANGTGYASFTFKVQDDGGVANGGVDLDTVARTLTIDVTAVNDAPVGTSTSITAIEDTTFVFNAAAFGYTDPRDTPANNLIAVQISTLPGAGSLLLNGVAVGAAQSVSIADINAGNLVFNAAAGANGAGYASFSFRVQDDGGIAGGGADLDAVARTMTIDVTSVNDAPTGTSKTMVTLEDTPVVFTLADFGYSDAGDTPANNFLAVKIGALPTAGNLMLNGVAVAGGQAVLATDIATGKLVYNAAANAHGAGYASFTFQVQDDGGTAGPGVDLDAVARTMTIDVTSVNDAPTGTNRTLVTLEDAPVTFTLADFGYADASDTPADSFVSVTIASLPGAGSLELNGAAVGAGQSIATADIAAGKLVFSPGANAHGAAYASFTFEVRDSGGIAGGGVDLDTVARTMTIAVTSVNDAPIGSDKTVVATEDTPFVFDVAAFGFTDPGDSPANGFAQVEVSSLAAAGALTLNGVAVTAGQHIGVADIAAGRLAYTAASNAHGAGYASFTFRVHDDGGSADGGADADAIARTMTIDVTPVNDMPTGAGTTVVTTEDAPFVFGTATFGYADVGDTPANAFVAVRIVTLPGAGSLALNGVVVAAGTNVSVADIAGGKLVYTPAPNDNGAGYASFTFKVQDDGGGADLDTVARTIAIDVTAVNDAPLGASNTVMTSEDTAFAFSAAAFGFTDAADTDNLLSVKIVSVASAGALTLDGVAVTAGQHVSAADIAAGKLAFAPAADAHGAGYASFTFQVRDDGGAAGGGVDLDVIARTMTLDVVPVDDALPVQIFETPMEMVATPVVVAQQNTVQTSASTASAAPVAAAPAGTATASAVPAATATAAAAAEAGDAPSGEAAAAAPVVGAEAPATGATGGTASSAQFVQVGVQRQDVQQPARDFRGPSLVAVQETQLVAPERVDLGGSVGFAASTLQSTTAASSAATAAVESRAMVQELDQMREGLQEHTKFEASVTAASAAAGMSFSVGYVVWMLRGGVLVSTLLSSLPAWRLVDPLPVLGRMDDDDDDDSDDSDDSLESLVARNNAASDEPVRDFDSPAEKEPA